ncbi:PIN domain-containing protein [Desulfurococcus amylolyticus]|uniref:Predicted nucleic acid-binding protein, containing PIN domain n=1 Tax=Desulfurococcus amylolyticus (strain DSM 18924 / JCM 16383 / VKM B-2413 / 1221n) TaxID=490899 RepID=B8D6E1_DESA1|nr:PIN domain-containing protein [Desulfurococcus amylolyticus]ACL11672.1 Predicted nucleic acid-binding protein, containing PIN domain [Desulfurococcus amylolyticus 1221n]
MSQNKGITVLLDTNMLLMMANGIPVLEQIEEKLLTKPRYIVIKPVYDELVRIVDSEKPSISRRARLALEIVNRYCEIVDYAVNPGETVDDAILRYASENNVVVATNDKELRRRLRSRGLPEIYLREESWRIDVEGVPSFY